MASREHGVARHRDPGLAGDDEGHQRFGFRVDPVETRRVRTEQLADAVGDALGHQVEVERLGEEPPEVGQCAHPLGLPRRLAIELGVVDRVRCMRGQRAEELHLLGGGLVPLAHADRQDSKNLLIDHERHDAHADHAGGARRLDVARPRVGERVGRRQRLARRHDGADESLADPHALEASGGGVGSGDGVERDVLAAFVYEPELGGARPEELRARPRRRRPAGTLRPATRWP